MYYLETNSIRIFSKHLSTPFYQSKCFTSILTVCELLSGIINNETFNKRKGILKRLYFSRIPSDLDMPETKLYKAYGIPVDNKTNEKIMILGALCIACKSYTEIQAEIQKSYLTEYWEFLKIYDKSSDSKFKESYQKQQDTFDYSDPNIIPDFKNRWNNLPKNRDLRERILYDLIVYFAETLLKPDSLIKAKDKSLKDLISIYDHSLDLYFLCIGYFTGTKLIFKNAPSRNDYFDLCHLMYLRNKSDIIVSNDTMLLKLMKKIHPHNIKTTTDFESKETNKNYTQHGQCLG